MICVLSPWQRTLRWQTGCEWFQSLSNDFEWILVKRLWIEWQRNKSASGGKMDWMVKTFEWKWKWRKWKISNELQGVLLEARHALGEGDSASKTTPIKGSIWIIHVNAAGGKIHTYSSGYIGRHIKLFDGCLF